MRKWLASLFSMFGAAPSPAGAPATFGAWHLPDLITPHPPAGATSTLQSAGHFLPPAEWTVTQADGGFRTRPAGTYSGPTSAPAATYGTLQAPTSTRMGPSVIPGTFIA